MTWPSLPRTQRWLILHKSVEGSFNDLSCLNDIYLVFNFSELNSVGQKCRLVLLKLLIENDGLVLDSFVRINYLVKHLTIVYHEKVG
jgi:hypothetical protein